MNRLPLGLSSSDKLQFLNDFTLVTFVRHPWVRLVSTFKDKIIDRKYKNWRELVDYKVDQPYQAFEKFVKLIIKKKLDNDPHVKSFWKKCDMCRLNYDIIGKMTSFDQDSKFILEQAGIQLQMNETHNSSSGDSSTSLARKYFSNLPKKMVDKLYEMYKIDFEMFHYKSEF